jgi:hypothetical protein
MKMQLRDETHARLPLWLRITAYLLGSLLKFCWRAFVCVFLATGIVVFAEHGNPPDADWVLMLLLSSAMLWWWYYGK